mmetsp:Transcript_108639/g.307104  ORF Transcript_108639/g.307104 Transcript_108639/m.307104 type:complete len:204 (+) Transcript_108639:115-726(+)
MQICYQSAGSPSGIWPGARPAGARAQSAWRQRRRFSAAARSSPRPRAPWAPRAPCAPHALASSRGRRPKHTAPNTPAWAATLRRSGSCRPAASRASSLQLMAVATRPQTTSASRSPTAGASRPAPAPAAEAAWGSPRSCTSGARPWRAATASWPSPAAPARATAGPRRRRRACGGPSSTCSRPRACPRACRCSPPARPPAACS